MEPPDMQRKKPLLVTLRATQPSVIELTTGETVQLDRVGLASSGRVAERHGPLLRPGTTRLDLAIGEFCFKTLSGAQLRVVHGGVEATTNGSGKGTPPPATAPQGDRGDSPDGEQPTLTVE